jgi:predicted  nucleic acid-binding Zn-ribbon protein
MSAGLQSTNGELETMNEELQSTNEELQTVNEELRQLTEKVIMPMLSEVHRQQPALRRNRHRSTSQHTGLEPSGRGSLGSERMKSKVILY